ncbi:retrovirus-related pol polyprotein from transposon TNT 1-94, partial [Tanacetum coccineum]
MPPRRSSATARAAAAARAVAAAATPITAAAVEQLIEARVSAALANHETLRNSTNGHGDGSHNSGIGNRGTTRTPHECTYKDFLNCHPLNFKGTEGVVVLAQWFEKMESVFHISNCVVENQVKFATCTFIRNALTWWNSHMKAVTQDVAYAMDWKTLKKMMTVKYCPRGEIKKLEIELWNLKVKGTDITSYTLRFQELALMCGRMFPEESDEVEKYVGGLPGMIRGNVMSYRPQTMEETIEFANDQMDQKLITITERQAEQKRKLEYNAGNNQGHQQQNKRQNTGRAYTAGPGEKREYTGSLPLCTKCNYHHKGPCAPRCNKCKKIGHLARDCRSSSPNGNNNNHGNSGTTQNAGTCYECGVQGHFKRDCPKLKNKNHGLGHNLFSVGYFCDSDLEVAFKKHTCFVRDLDDVDLIKGSCGTNLYTISVEDMMRSSPICLLSKASKNKSWLWHRRLNHLNFGTFNDLARKNLVRGLPRLKFEKDHLCSACQLGKSRKATHKPKTVNTIMEVLHTLHMDLCGPMSVQGINRKKYILVIVDDYSRFTWVKFLRSKDETPDVGITHEKTITRTPQQNGVVERRNRNLVEAARTMLIFSKAPMFIWVEAIATACYTQNRSLIHTLHNKTPYELVHDKKLDLSFICVFGALCYLTNDSEDLGKLKAKADIGFFVCYTPNKKGYRIYSKRTRQVMETIHVTFDELTGQTAHVHSILGPAPNLLMLGPISSGLVPNLTPAAPYVPPTYKELEILFQPMFDEYF